MSTVVVALASRHVGAFERWQRAASLRGKVARWWPGVSQRWARLVLVATLGRDAAFLTEQAIWYRGAAVNIDSAERAAPLDPQFILVGRVREIEGTLLEMRERLLNQAAYLASIKGSASFALLAQQVAVTSRAAAECYEALRDFRGALQAYEADRCALTHAAGHALASTAQELQAHLDAALRS